MGRIQGETSQPGEPVGSVEQTQDGDITAVPFPPAQPAVGNDSWSVGGGNEVYGDPQFHHQTVQNHIGEPWTTGLFDCQQHQINAIMTALLPCVTFGQISEILEEGEMTCPLGSFIYLLMMPALCSQWIMGSKYRAKLRKKYNLVEAPHEDWASHVFCPCCSLCQEFRELKNRGKDPTLGWNGYLAQQQARQMKHQDEVKTPPQDQTMFK